MSLAAFSLRRRVTVTMCAIALVVFGGVAFTRLPVTLLPEISYPSLTVETRLPGAAPEEVETLVSRPVEEAVGIVGGVRRLTSVSRPGLSQVTLEFGWDRDMDFASIDVREKLERVVLPREAKKPVLLRFDPANEPVLRLYVTGGENLYKLRYFADEILKKDLESADGVAAIQVNGGYEEEIEVRVDEGKLALFGVRIEEVNDRLLRENVNQAGGSLYEQEARYLVRARNEFRNLDDILRTVLFTKDGRNVTMADVAEVRRGHRQREVVTRFGGREAVELSIYKEGDANTVAVSRSIQHRLERLKPELPAGVEVAAGADQSRFIQASIREVINNAVVGGVLAVLILLLFLKDLTSTLIISVSIPISIVATFFLMYQTGTSLNVMSLGGLALGVGMLVDNAIVVLEAIFKRREEGESGLQAALGGATEVGRAVVASTLTTVAVFVPVVFVEGIAAQLFRDQALTVSFSLMASLVVSLTLIPLFAGLRRDAPQADAGGLRPVEAAAATGDLVTAAGEAGRAARAARLLRRGAQATGSGAEAALGGARRGAARLISLLAAAARPVARVFDAGLEALMRSYPPVLAWALRAPVTVLVLALAAFAASLWVVRGLGIDLVPTLSQGEFSFLVELPEGTPLEATDRYVRDAAAVLEGDRRVASFSTTAGGAGLSLTRTGSEGENAARILVRMQPGARGAEEEVVADALRGRLQSLPAGRFKFERPSLFTFRTPIEVEVYGDDLGEIRAAAAALRSDVQNVPGLVDVKSSDEAENPEVQVTFDRGRLASLGLDLFQVAGTVRNKVQGEVATRFLEGDREIEIRVRALAAGSASVADVGDMIVGQRGGVPISLKSVAEVRVAQGPSEIRRIGQKRVVVISANLSGRDMGGAAADVQSVIRAQSFPAGVIAALSGQEEEMQRSFRSLWLAMALAIFLVYLVMAAEFESLLHPFVVMFTVPLAAVGAVGALALAGATVNVVAIIGWVMLAGIVVNNAIVLIDAVNQFRARGMDLNEALREAGLRRMRPILMTTSTTVLGLLPMALGLGEGSELQAPLAITVIGGLSVATVLTLLVIPAVCVLAERVMAGARRSPVALARGVSAPGGAGGIRLQAERAEGLQ